MFLENQFGNSTKDVYGDFILDDQDNSQMREFFLATVVNGLSTHCQRVVNILATLQNSWPHVDNKLSTHYQCVNNGLSMF